MPPPTKSLLACLVEPSTPRRADSGLPESAVDIRRIRESLGMTQERFAAAFGFDPAAVREWELDALVPNDHARAFLTVIQREPDAVARALEDERTSDRAAG